MWHICQPVTPDEFLAIAKSRLDASGTSAAAASTLAVGNHYLIRNMERRRRWPSVDSLRALCGVLGLEFYVGPPRPPADDPGTGLLVPGSSLRLTRSQLRARRRYLRDLRAVRESAWAVAHEAGSPPGVMVEARVIHGMVDGVLRALETTAAGAAAAKKALEGLEGR